MLVFHGSTTIVNEPEIRISDRFLDFGYGFYVTINKEQAIKWAEKQKSRKLSKNSYISSYEFDIESAKSELKIIHFSEADKDWLEFVSNNRKGHCNEEYDIAIGPVADDGVYEVIRFYETGIYNLEETLKRLKVEEQYNQILFHTEKSLKYLKFLAKEEL